MSVDLGIAGILNEWLAKNSMHISGHFECERVNNWDENDQGIALDLWNDRARGRVTAWPKHLAVADWPFADVEIIDVATGQTFFGEQFVEFNHDLLDRWLSALDVFSGSKREAT